MEFLDLDTTELVGFLTFSSIIFAAAASTFRNLLLSHFEQLLTTDNQSYKMFLLFAITLIAAFSFYSFVLFTKIFPEIYELSYFSTINTIVLVVAIITSVYLIYLITQFFNPKKNNIKRYTTCLVFLTIYSNFEAFSLFANRNYEDANTLIFACIFFAMASSLLLFVKLCFYHTRLTKSLNLRVSILTDEEKDQIFSEGLYHVKTINLDTHIVTPHFDYDKSKNIYPQYVLYTQTESIHMFDPETKIDGFPPRSDKAKKKRNLLLRRKDRSRSF